MSNPTTPFGWQMPENTDLVTDLPADFEVFGQAVATDFQYLLGGTTGQVLKKDSNTDLDFVWAADAAGMTNPMTTTGDVIYSSPGSTPVRLGIGSAGEVLTVASGVPSWAAVSAGGMTLLSTTTLTGSSTTISSIDQGYKNLYIVGQSIYNSVNDVQMRYRLNGDSTGEYYFNYYGSTGYQFAGDYDNAVTSVVFGFVSNTNTAAETSKFVMDMPRYSETQVKYINSNSYAFTGASGRAYNATGVYRITTAVSSITFFPASGTWSGGTIYVYGVK